MKKILFFISSMEDGGAQRVISQLSNNLVERGFDVEILKYFKGENVFKLNEKIKVNSIEENTNTTSKLTNIKWLRKYINDNSDIVISFLAPFNIIALLANNSKPIIVADRNDPRLVPSNKIIRKLRDVLYQKADAVVLQTNDNKNYFNKKVKSISYVIPNPISMDDYVGKALNTKKEKVIVSVGRLEKQKNQLLLINAFAKVYEKHNDYKLIIYGEGNYRKELEDRIKELKLEETIKLPGSTNKVFDDISSAEAFVLSSNYEGMPNALMEAMCLGLPVISTKVSGSTDLIINEENGLIIDINDELALVKSINKLIEDKDNANNLAVNAIKLNEKIKVSTIVDKWENIIIDI